MLCDVGVHHKDKNTSVEELSKQHSLSDKSLLRGDCCFPDPLYQLDDDKLQSRVDSDDEERDGLAKNEAPKGVAEVLLADGSLELHCVVLYQLIVEVLCNSRLLFLLTEALHNSSEVAHASFLKLCVVDPELVDCIPLPRLIAVARVLLHELAAVHRRVLVLQG